MITWKHLAQFIGQKSCKKILGGCSTPPFGGRGSCPKKHNKLNLLLVCPRCNSGYLPIILFPQLVNVMFFFFLFCFVFFFAKVKQKHPLANFFESLFSNLTFCLLECTHLGVYQCKIATPYYEICSHSGSLKLIPFLSKLPTNPHNLLLIMLLY